MNACSKIALLLLNLSHTPGTTCLFQSAISMLSGIRSFIVTSIAKIMNYNLLALFAVITGPSSTLGQVNNSGRNSYYEHNSRESTRPLPNALTLRQLLPSTYSRTGLPLLMMPQMDTAWIIMVISAVLMITKLKNIYI